MFSELVDMVVRRTNRPDFREDIVAYANEVLRMVHSSEFFYRDKVEVLAKEDANDGVAYQLPETFVWDRPKDLRAIIAVKYLPLDRYSTIGDYRPFDFSDPKSFYPSNIPPGIGQATQDSYYYAVGDKFVFYRKGGLGNIAVCYSKAPPYFHYYTENLRPAVYDYTTGYWSYLDGKGEYVGSLGTEEADSLARAKVADWVLKDYLGMVASGVATKVFTVLGDPRNKIEYSNFKEALRYVRTAEKYEATGEVGYNR